MDLSLAIRRVVVGVALPIALAMAVLAVVVAAQSGPTVTAARARSDLGAVVARVAAAVGVPTRTVAERAPAAACSWLGTVAASGTGKVAPELQVEGVLAGDTDPVAVLDGIARQLGGTGWTVIRTGGAGLTVSGPDGYGLVVEIHSEGGRAATVRITGRAPCVWPDGERKPAP